MWSLLSQTWAVNTIEGDNHTIWDHKKDEVSDSTLQSLSNNMLQHLLYISHRQTALYFTLIFPAGVMRACLCSSCSHAVAPSFSSACVCLSFRDLRYFPDISDMTEAALLLSEEKKISSSSTWLLFNPQPVIHFYLRVNKMDLLIISSLSSVWIKSLL